MASSRCASAAAWAPRACLRGSERTAKGKRPPATGHRPTGHGQRATGNGQRATGNGQRTHNMTTATEQTIKGGAWVIEETDPSTVMTPEQLSEEHRLIG